MANVKITELTAATALAGTDVLPIVDVGADATKKVSVSDLLRNLPDGTASAPALAFADDQNTGLLSPAANELAIATSGTQRLVVDSSGKVGVNKTASTYQLEVNAGTPNTVASFESTDATARILFKDNSGEALVGATGNNLTFYTSTSATERMRIDSSGRVGIGTTSPAVIFHAVDTVNGDSAGFRFSNEGTGSGSAVRLQLYSSSSTASKQVASIHADAEGGAAGDGQLSFYTRGSNSVSERMRIDSSGKVGIGTTSPAGGLHVDAASGVDGPIFDSGGTGNTNHALLVRDSGNNQLLRVNNNGNVGIGTTSPNYSLHLSKSGSTAVYQQFTNGAVGTGSSDGLLIGINASGDALVYHQDSNHMRFGTANTERMRINSNGNVGINNSSPQSKLDVNGDIRIASSSAVLSTSSGGTIQLQGGATYPGGNILLSGGSGTDDIRFRTTGASATSTERMRINSSGVTNIHRTTGAQQLRIGTLDGSSFEDNENTMQVYGHSATDFIQLRGCNTADGTPSLEIKVNNVRSIEIEADGDIYNVNGTYGTISDARLKENIVDASSQWGDVKDLQVRNFNFTEASGLPTNTQIGFVAQEVEQVSPGLVKTNPDLDQDGNDLGTTTKAVKTSVLLVKAIKALQEAMDRIETLETKVAALEAQ